VKDLAFTLEDAPGRELGVIYNLLPLDERISSTILINIYVKYFTLFWSICQDI